MPCAFFPVVWDGQWEKKTWQIDKRPVMTSYRNCNRWFWCGKNGDGQVQTNEFFFYSWVCFNNGLDIDQKGKVYMGGRVLDYSN